MIFVDTQATHLRFIETEEKAFDEKVYVPADRTTWTFCATYTSSSGLLIRDKRNLPPVDSMKIRLSKIIQISKTLYVLSNKTNENWDRK
jgi:hypothetical protein